MPDIKEILNKVGFQSVESVKGSPGNSNKFQIVNDAYTTNLFQFNDTVSNVRFLFFIKTQYL